MVKSNEKQEKEAQIVEKAKVLAIEHFKKKYNATVYFTGYRIFPSYVGPYVDLSGYLNGQKDQDFIISIDYKDLKVIEAAVPPDLLP